MIIISYVDDANDADDGGGGNGNGSNSLFVSWCFEPCQPLRIM